jgi:hypothetical protein
MPLLRVVRAWGLAFAVVALMAGCGNPGGNGNPASDNGQGQAKFNGMLLDDPAITTPVLASQAATNDLGLDFPETKRWYFAGEGSDQMYYAPHPSMMDVLDSANVVPGYYIVPVGAEASDKVIGNVISADSVVFFNNMCVGGFELENIIGMIKYASSPIDFVRGIDWIFDSFCSGGNSKEYTILYRVFLSASTDSHDVHSWRFVDMDPSQIKVGATAEYFTVPCDECFTEPNVENGMGDFANATILSNVSVLENPRVIPGQHR